MSRLRPYRDYVESGSYWIGDVPAGWSTKRLRHIASFWNSNVDKKTYEGQQSVLLCNYTDVYYNEFIRPGLQFMGATASTKEIEQFTLRCGDIIVTKDSEDASDIGIPTLVTNDLPGVVCGYHLTLIRTSEEVSPRFLHRAIQAHPSKAYFNVESPGITRFGLGQDTIGDLPIVFPAVSDQEKIADWIDSQTSRIDTLIEKKTRFIELLKEKRQALITHAVTKGLNPDAPMRASGIEWLGEVPAHWSVMSLRHCCKIIDCKHVTAPFVDEGIPVISIREVQGRNVDCTWSRKTDPATAELLSERGRRPRVGDLIYSRNATVGQVALVTEDTPQFVMGQDVSLLRPSESVVPGFLHYVLRSRAVLDQLEGIMVGATFRRLNVDNIGSLLVTIPPTSEQMRIDSYVDQKTGQIDQLSELVEKSVCLLKERRSAIINAAVTGKIDLRDAA